MTDGNSANLTYQYQNINSFYTNTCPVMVKYFGDASAVCGIEVLTAVVGIVAGLYIKTAPNTTSVFGVIWSFLSACMSFISSTISS